MRYGVISRQKFGMLNGADGEILFVAELADARAGQKAQPFFSAFTDGFESSAQPSAHAPL